MGGFSPVSYGAGVGVSEMGPWFYYGGWLSNGWVVGSADGYDGVGQV